LTPAIDSLSRFRLSGRCTLAKQGLARATLFASALQASDLQRVAGSLPIADALPS
jgi:hypothetical protein